MSMAVGEGSDMECVGFLANAPPARADSISEEPFSVITCAASPKDAALKSKAELWVRGGKAIVTE